MARCTSSRSLIHLRWISLVLLVPYLALAIGAEELHKFSCKSHSHNLLAYSRHSEHSTSGGLIVSKEPLPGLQGGIHDADSCILCQWLKYSPQGLTPKGASLVFTSSEFSDNFPNIFFQILALDKKLSRAPPA